MLNAAILQYSYYIKNNKKNTKITILVHYSMNDRLHYTRSMQLASVNYKEHILHFIIDNYSHPYCQFAMSMQFSSVLLFCVVFCCTHVSMDTCMKNDTAISVILIKITIFFVIIAGLHFCNCSCLLLCSI